MKKILKKIFKSSYLLKLYRNIRDFNDKNQKPINTQWGFSIAGNKNMALGDFEPEETKLVSELLKDVDIFINVGANVGYYCCHALNLGKKVIAFEPMYRNCHYLIQNIKNNGWSNNAQIFPIALGENVDVLNIWGGDTGASLIKGWASIPEDYVTQIPVNTIDNILSNKIKNEKALILIDVEGAEFFVLKGAKSFLNNIPAPTWIIEISKSELHNNNSNPYFLETFNLFLDNGYSVYSANEERFPLSKYELEEIAKGSKILDVGNFLFIKQ